jgi:MFS family permease
MKTSSMQDIGAPASSSQTAGASRVRESEKQPVHEYWWLLSLFAAVVPFAMSLGISLRPLEELVMEDSEWTPRFSKEDTILLDGAMLAPGVIMPVLIGIAMDAVWSVNLSLLICLIGSVMGSFLVAMGFAWYSFGLALTGRVISGFCFGSIFVVADTIAAQFNRRRKGATFALISAVKTAGFALNAYWMRNFTVQSLDSDYEKMDDVLLIAALVCLGIGFLWSPLVASLNMDDSAKRRRMGWKWHIGAPLWGFALCTMITGMFFSNIFFDSNSTSYTAMLLSSFIISPLLGWWMDTTDRSQNGSLAIMNFLSGMTWILLFGQMLRKLADIDLGLSGIAVGILPMLLRLGVTQLTSRDNVSTSFGVIESAAIISGIMVRDSAPPNFLNQLILLALIMFIFAYGLHTVRDKWGSEQREEGRLEKLVEPLYARGA